MIDKFGSSTQNRKRYRNIELSKSQGNKRYFASAVSNTKEGGDGVVVK